MNETRQAGKLNIRHCFDFLIKIYICFYMLFMVLLTLNYFPDSWLSAINLVSLVTGAALILTFFVLDRPFLPGKPYFPVFVILCVLFVCFGVTILINRSLNPFGNIKALLTNTIQLLLIFYYLAYAPREQSASLARLAMGSLIALTFVLAAANTIIVLGGITVRHDIYTYAGLFSNPNNSSICAVSILCSLYFLRVGRKPSRWGFLLLNMALQFVVVILCRSRACIIMLAVGVAVFTVSYIFELQSVKKSRQLLMVLALAAAAAAVFLLSQNLIKPIKTGSTSAGTSAYLDMQQVKNSSNTKRMNFLICGSKVFLEHPLFGVGPRNVADTVKGTFPQTDLQGIEKGGLHNAYLQLLVSNGLAGALAVLALAVYCVGRIFKARVYENYYILAILAGLLVYALFEVNVFFVNFANSMIFWSVLGYSLSLARAGRQPVSAAVPEGDAKPIGPA